MAKDRNTRGFEMPETLPTGNEKRNSVQAMFDAISGRYDLVNRIMTFGLDRRWRSKTVESLQLNHGGLVLDLACGTGDLCFELTKHNCNPVGVDFSFGMLSNARRNFTRVCADGETLPFAENTFDALTCGFALRNFVNLDTVINECARVLKPGARIALLEVAQPKGRMVRAGHQIYFNKVVPLIGAALSNRSAYKYLPKSAAYLPPVPEMAKKLEQSGFIEVSQTLLPTGAAQILGAVRG